MLRDVFPTNGPVPWHLNGFQAPQRWKLWWSDVMGSFEMIFRPSLRRNKNNYTVITVVRAVRAQAVYRSVPKSPNFYQWRSIVLVTLSCHCQDLPGNGPKRKPGAVYRSVYGECRLRFGTVEPVDAVSTLPILWIHESIIEFSQAFIHKCSYICCTRKNILSPRNHATFGILRRAKKKTALLGKYPRILGSISRYSELIVK